MRKLCRKLSASKTSRNDRCIPAIVCCRIVMIWMVFRRWWCQSVDSHSTNLGDMSHEWSLAIKYVKHSQAMFVRPAQHLPTHSTANEKRSSMHWHSPLGGEVLGQAAIHSPLEGGQMSPANMVTAACNKCCWEPHHSMLILLGLGGNDLFQKTSKVIHCSTTCDLASAFRQGCQITNFTKFEKNQETWEVLFCTNTVLWSCISMSSTSSNGILGGKTQNISAYPGHMGEFCWAWLEREAKDPTFLKTPRCKALGSACWHFGISISSINTLIWNSSFCQPFRQGSKLVNWEKSTLGWAERLWNGAKHGEDEKSHVEQLQNFRPNKLFHLGEKMWARISVNSSNIEENRAQIIYPVRVSLLHISATSKILHFRTCNCCI